jgi:hypothetical protein
VPFFGVIVSIPLCILAIIFGALAYWGKGRKDTYGLAGFILGLITIILIISSIVIAATVYVYVGGMIGGTQTQTPTLSMIVDAGQDKIIVVSTDYDLKWTDITITSDDSDVVWVIYSNGGSKIGKNNTMPLALVTLGDYLKVLDNAAGNVKFTFIYKPTNSIIYSSTVKV